MPLVRRFELGQRLAFDGMAAGEQEEQEHANRVDVAGGRRPGAGQQLRCHVERRALPGRRMGVVDAVRPAEVHQHDASADFAHHVGGLDVAMDQGVRVQRRHGAADVDADAGRLARAHRPAGDDGVGQRLAVDQLHPQARLAAVVLGAVDGDDVRVTDPGQGAGFAQRRRAPVGERVQELDRHFAIELRVPGAMDVAGEARGERLEDEQRAPRSDGGPGPVRSDPRALPRRRRRCRGSARSGSGDGARRRPAIPRRWRGPAPPPSRRLRPPTRRPPAIPARARQQASQSRGIGA